MNPQPPLIVLGLCTVVMLGGWLAQRRLCNLVLADLL